MPKTNIPSKVHLPPVRVEPNLREALLAMAAKEGRTLSELVRSFLREQVERRGGAL